MCLYLGSSILRVWVLLWSSDLLHLEDEKAAAATAAIQVMMTRHFSRQLLQFSSALRYRGCTQAGLCLLHGCCWVMRNTQTVSVDPKNSLLKWPVIINIPVFLHHERGEWTGEDASAVSLKCSCLRRKIRIETRIRQWDGCSAGPQGNSDHTLKAPRRFLLVPVHHPSVRPSSTQPSFLSKAGGFTELLFVK